MLLVGSIIISIIISIMLLLSMVLIIVHLEGLDLLSQVGDQSLANCIPLLLERNKR